MAKISCTRCLNTIDKNIAFLRYTKGTVVSSRALQRINDLIIENNLLKRRLSDKGSLNEI